MNTLKLLAVLGVCTALAAAAFAHTDLASSTPGNGAIVATAPEAIELNFTGEVQLLKLQIVGSDSGEVSSSFKLTAAQQRTFVVELPALVEDTYTVNWKVLGADGHQVEKSVAFTVGTGAREGASTAPDAASHAGHAH